MKQIGMLDSQVIRAALLALVGLAGLIASFFGVDETLFSEKAGRLVEALLLVLTTGSVLWAAYARATKPTPPITDTAAEKTAIMQQNQGGFARPMALLAVAILAGCAALGLPTASNFSERLAVGYNSVISVRESATILVQADVIKPDDAQNVQNQADNARAGLDIASSLRTLDPKAAEARLVASIQILNALESYLRSRKP